MTLPDRITVSPDVMTRRVGEEIVMLQLESGTYFGLDPVGSRIWQLLAEGNTAAQARDRLLAEYEVAPAQIESDIEKLIGELRAHGLVSAE
jgi:hypothetical protein